ncbi:nuclear transport factor 2 family protein [Ferruginibacter sp.]|nr:nuclear transport factor 2 family protein [Ferruginibacter sp.]
MKQEQLIKEFQTIEDNFNKAVISNNIDEISKCISTDWVLVDAQGGIIPKERFYDVVVQGLLKHTTMTKEILRVKVYDNIALVTGRGKTQELGKANQCKRTNGLQTFTKRKG